MKPSSATPSRLKYLKCECCSFLAVIPRHDRHEGLLCPFCTKVQCAHGGKFFEVTRDTFENEADLDTPRSERVMPSLQEQADDELRMRLDHPLSLTRAVDALRGMYGLLQLFASRSEIAQHLGDWESNHRAEEARLVMALAEQHGSASRSATAESDPVKALAANLTETDAARWRFVARMWPIDLLMLLNSHMDGLDDMLVGEAVDKAIAADIPRHK